jgi:hypothetical protein
VYWVRENWINTIRIRRDSFCGSGSHLSILLIFPKSIGINKKKASDCPKIPQLTYKNKQTISKTVKKNIKSRVFRSKTHLFIFFPLKEKPKNKSARLFFFFGRGKNKKKKYKKKAPKIKYYPPNPSVLRPVTP